MKLPEGSSFSIRPAVMRDLDTLAAIDAVCFPTGIAYPREEILFLLLNPTIMIVVAECAGIIIGFAALERRRRTRKNARNGELVTIEVLPEFRGETIVPRSIKRWKTICAIGEEAVSTCMFLSITRSRSRFISAWDIASSIASRSITCERSMLGKWKKIYPRAFP